MRKALWFVVGVFVAVSTFTPLVSGSMRLQQQQEQQQRKQSIPQDIVPPKEPSPAYLEKGKEFEDHFVKTVKAIRNGRVTFREFDSMWRAFLSRATEHPDPILLIHMDLFEAGREKLSNVLGIIATRALQEGDIGCGDCSAIVDLWVNGCLHGGGDVWVCFLDGEQFRCICENEVCGGIQRDCQLQ